MELSSTTKAKVDNLKKQGYSAQEILAYFGAEKYGEMSVVHNEEMDRAKQKEQVIENSFKWRDIVATPGKYLAKDAVDVFGTKLFRRGIGTDTSTDITQEYLDEPTKLQFAGAVLQSLGLAAGAISPLTLGRSVALNIGLGYSYDVGEDLVAQEEMKETLTPGLATIIAGSAPLAFASIRAGVRALLKPTEEVATQVGSQMADDVGRATASVVRESVPEVATQPVTQAVDDLAKPVADKVTDASSEMARNVFNRFTRAGRHLQEYAEDKATRQVLRQDATPAMKFALDEGIETRTITRIGSADDVTRNAYKAVVQAAESGQPATAENVAGNYVVEMYKTARKQQDLIGEQLGEARRKLGNDIISNSVYQPTRRTMTSVFKDNGINLNIDGTVSFDTSKYIPEEEKVIQDIWSRVARYDTISPSEVDEIMQYLSKLEYRTNVTDKLSGVYIDVVDSKTGQVMPTNLFSYIRNTFDNLLEQVDTSGQIGALRKQYSQAKSVTSRVEDSWFSGLDIRKSTDSELSEAASLALRRLDSRAKSKTTYGQMYRALDKYARAFGYNGPDASDVSSFYLKEVEPLYPETTPPASFRGGIVGGIRSVLENVIDFGESNVTDKQKALRGLLGIEDIAKTPTSLTTKSMQQLEAQTETVLRDIEASQVESSIKNNISEIRRQSGQGGFANFFSNTTARQQQTQVEGINDLIAEWQRRALLPTATKSEINAANKAVNKLKKQLADILPDSFKKGEIPSTNLLEEAKKYKSAELSDIPDVPVEHTRGGNAVLYWGGDSPVKNLDTAKMSGETRNIRGGGVYVTSNPDYAKLYSRFTDNELRGRVKKTGRDIGYIQKFELEQPLFDTSKNLTDKEVLNIKKAYEDLLEVTPEDAGFPDTNNANKIYSWLEDDTGLDLAVLQDAGFGGIKNAGSNEVQVFDSSFLKNIGSQTIKFVE